MPPGSEARETRWHMIIYAWKDAGRDTSVRAGMRQPSCICASHTSGCCTRNRELGIMNKNKKNEKKKTMKEMNKLNSTPICRSQEIV